MIKTFCDICRREINEGQHTATITVETTRPETRKYSDVCLVCTSSVINHIGDLKTAPVNKREDPK